MGMRENLNRGALDLMILSLLTESEQYGYQLSQAITARSEGVINLAEGTLYPVLYRLMESGCISGNEVQVGKRRKRIYYHIEPSGLQYLQEMLPAYRAHVNAVLALLDSCSLPFEEGSQEHE